MAKNRRLSSAVHYALAAAAAIGAPTAYAQTAPASVAPASTVEEVVVTGSRLRTPNEISISPIASITSGDVAATGLTRVEDILNNLPMIFASQGSNYSNGSDGTATVNLRGLGAQRTLVLVNGRRLGPGSADGRNYSDINQVPAALIERVDILTGGASAVYGADAVAGVVNFILNTKFEGVKIDTNYNFYQHHNGNDIQSTVTAAGYPLPPSNVNTGYGKDVSVLIGSNFADGKGNATFYATYTNISAVLQGKYDYGSCALNAPSAKNVVKGRLAACGGSGTAATGYFQAYDTVNVAPSPLAGGALFTNTVDKGTGAFRPFNRGPGTSDYYNFGPVNYFQRPSERYTAGTFLNYDVNSHVNAYAEFMFTRTTSVAQIAPSGDFFLLSHISCANPLLTASEKAVICDPANLARQGSTDGLDMYIGRRNVEGGGRQEAFANTSYRTTIGAKGDFGGDAWKWDFYGQYGTTAIAFQNLNYLSNTAIQNALNVVTDPTTGQPVCQSVLDKTDKNCVPWNIWVPGGVTPAATNYLSIPLQIQGAVTEQVVSADLTGDLGKYGVQLPTAASGLQLNLGAEWREERATFDPDAASQAGIAAGAGGPTKAVAGGFHVAEVFTEMRLPLIDNKTGAESLAFETGYRYSNYSLGFTTNTYKFGVEWAPVRDIRARASYQRAVRAPNIGELFTPNAVLLDGSTDPCAGTSSDPINPINGTVNGHTFAECARSGVTATEFGTIKPNSASQYNGLLGGNPTLQPEKADTYALGLVFQPHVVPNLTLSLDYFDIKIKNVIGAIGGDTVLANCIATGASQFCGGIVRAPGTGSLWKSTLGYVTDLNVNFGELATKGIDLKTHYRLGIGSAGGLVFDLEGTKLQELITTPVSGGPSYDCAGLMGAKCLSPNPKWRHTLMTTWNTPWKGLDFGIRWRYFGEADSELTSGNPLLHGTPYPASAHVAAYNYLDVSGAIQMSSVFSLRLGINNLLDKDPPIIPSGATSGCPTGPCNGNTWAQAYDTLGRYVYIHLTAQF